MTDGLIYLSLGIFSIWFGVAARRDSSRPGDWTSMLRRGTTRDTFFFIAMPWGGLVPLSAGFTVLGRALSSDLLQLIGLLLVPLAAVGGLIALFWGVLGIRPPLFMFPTWYRPVKAEDRSRRRLERQKRRTERRRSTP